MKILWFLVIFAVVVIAHEFGHFLVAKANGVRVVEFTVGMGPILLKKQGKETLYTWRLLPLGGACIFENEDGLDTEEKKKKAEEAEQVQELIPDTEKDRSLPAASVWVRIATYAAGPIFNFLLAFFFSLIVVGMSGSDRTEILSVIEGYPAQEAGLMAGDEIISLNGERVHLYREVTLFSQLNQGEEVKIVYERDGERHTAVIHPRYDEEAGRYYIGFSGGVYEKCNALDTIKAGYYEVRYWIKVTYKSLFMLFRGEASVKDLSGPVGMAQVVGEVYEEASEYGILTLIASMLNFAILLSANLGVVNLLPLPALDGGRLVFAFIEAVRGKPVPRDKEAIVHFVGFVLLLVLMVFVMYNDIMRLFK
ncbi:MAG: RIP metalloprotease RseP [Clostridium sp.]|nr:RIP metalloprotease RseP [Clostridium sp.]